MIVPRGTDLRKLDGMIVTVRDRETRVLCKGKLRAFPNGNEVCFLSNTGLFNGYYPSEFREPEYAFGWLMNWIVETRFDIIIPSIMPEEIGAEDDDYEF